MALVEMRIALVTVDPYLHTPVVVLEETQGNRLVPIWIGQSEALAIVTAVQKIPMVRPMTHDLLKAAITSLAAKVESIEIVDLREGTYYAIVRVRAGSRTVTLDARPSDAIALALRTGSPIRVAEDVIERAGKVEVERTPSVAIAGDVTPGLLEKLKDDAFPKWKM